MLPRVQPAVWVAGRRQNDIPTIPPYFRTGHLWERPPSPRVALGIAYRLGRIIPPKQVKAFSGDGLARWRERCSPRREGFGIIYIQHPHAGRRSGRHADHGVRPTPPPTGDDVEVNAGVLEATRREGSLVLRIAWEDRQSLLGIRPSCAREIGWGHSSFQSLGTCDGAAAQRCGSSNLPSQSKPWSWLRMRDPAENPDKAIRAGSLPPECRSVARGIVRHHQRSVRVVLRLGRLSSLRREPREVCPLRYGRKGWYARGWMPRKLHECYSRSSRHRI